jgi:hypothetical protein
MKQTAPPMAQSEETIVMDKNPKRRILLRPAEGREDKTSEKESRKIR